MALVVPQFSLPSCEHIYFAMPTLYMASSSTPDARTCALDATSTESWGPSRSLMEELLAHTRTRHCTDVLHVLHDALTSHTALWRRILKALTTIAYCIRKGSHEVVLFATAHRALISQLTRFEYVDAYRLDRGAAVREEAEAVLAALSEESAVAKFRGGTGTGRSASRASSRSKTPTPHHNARRTPVTTPFPTNPHQLFVFSPVSVLQPSTATPAELDREIYHDSTRLAALISHIETGSAFESDDVWLNIYKLIFLLHVTLPTASDETIDHWALHTTLFDRLQALKSRASPDDSVAEEVHRLTGELARLFRDAASAKEVRRRARMF